ncbi:MAG: M28 family peptidase [Pyrinomonadaceae bacterium]
MKKSIFFVVCIFVYLPAFAQQPKPTPTLYSAKTITELGKLQKSALESNYAYRRLAHLTNNIGPRLTGSPQAAKAVEYVADEMRKAGLEVRLQKVTVPHWVRGKETGEIVQFEGMAPGTTQKIVLAALGGSIATPEQGLTADVIVVNSFDELEKLGRGRIEGKIVLFNNKFDRDLQDSGFGGAAYSQAVQYRFNGAVAAARFGAIGVLVRSAGGSQNRLVHTGAMGYDSAVARIPAAAVTFEDAETLAYLAGMGNVRVHFTITPETLPDATSYNVIGEIRGSEKPDEIVVVGGHLDSWDLGTGALDDGAGVAVSMQVGFLVNFLKLKPKRTIRIIAFMNEENGGAGGKGYADEQKANFGKHFAAIESDLGASHPLGFYFAGKAEALPFFAPISKILLDQGAAQVQLQPGGVGADIGAMTTAGVPSFAPWFDQRTYFNFHHTAADTFDKIDSKQLAEVGSVMAVLAYGLANLEQPLPR